MNRIRNILIAFDQLVNAICNGYPDETLSARAYRQHLKSSSWKWTYIIINKIFFWQKDHCKGAYLSEMSRKHLPNHYKE